MAAKKVSDVYHQIISWDSVIKIWGKSVGTQKVFLPTLHEVDMIIRGCMAACQHWSVTGPPCARGRGSLITLLLPGDLLQQGVGSHNKAIGNPPSPG